MRLDEIVAAVQALSPGQRRRLLRRLSATGLLEAEDLATDQRRLDVAPALGLARARAMAERQAAKQTPPARATMTAPKPSTPAAAEEQYRSPVSGHVVLGAPTAEVTDDDPHAMSPLPGHAPDKPIEIIFDGGSRGNPGQGYGSYALRWPGQAQQIVQLKFGQRVTNNEAEYDTLIAALEATLARLRDAGADPKTATLLVRGDSLLVINQAKGEWQCKEERLRKRLTRVQDLVARFKECVLIHHPREKSVEVLGH
jgi:ribonuclease HI